MLDHTEVLIKVHACGVNVMDTYIRAGSYANAQVLPYIPGTDVAGEIQRVGIHVARFKKGDRVFTLGTVTGGYAEFTVAAANTVFPLSDKLNFKQGAAIGVPYFTAYHALFQREVIKAGETLLIHGASGGVGMAACQIARAHGMKVLGTAGTEEGMKQVLKNGAHGVFNHRKKAYLYQIRETSGIQNIDVILEMLANVNLSEDLKLLSRGGRVMIVGCQGLAEIDPDDMMLKESIIRGISFISASKEEMNECAAAILAGIDAGWLKPVVGHEYPLAKAAEAHNDMAENKGALGKRVIVIC
ncbi:quinone oxidoreductase isoform X2 [Anolis carolinensis]|uniref:Enoyl reductase (ER) domain-containing protein n=1 Tax=Anolis carolinensis TaxID=28377 RepID=A0A803TJ71_ANOCA|nr:PREDICTED: quinone oxidoreductase isoform X2 [Anolis carolinensis]|eukprot:XP_008112306.1 PREDICTED: quinone oxidoreductase isoform X2 [Anolis carolinensis]